LKFYQRPTNDSDHIARAIESRYSKLQIKFETNTAPFPKNSLSDTSIRWPHLGEAFFILIPPENIILYKLPGWKFKIMHNVFLNNFGDGGHKDEYPEFLFGVKLPVRNKFICSCCQKIKIFKNIRGEKYYLPHMG